MAGIAGLYQRDGRPASSDLLYRMLPALAHRGPDGSDVWLAGSIGLAHLASRTTPEAGGERQPLSDDAGHVWITFDGRLDNRDDIITALGASASLRCASDAALVLEAYARWGAGAVARFVGDFAFALWDARSRELVCARDPLGFRPFYYHADRAAFLFASEPAALLADPALSVRPNEAFAAELLSAAPVHLEDTLFEGIHRLPPAHVLIVRSDGVTKARYWNPDPPEPGGLNDEEFGARFREVFDLAVSARLRSSGPVAALLSGGLDSSSIVITASALLREGRATAPGFEALSLVFPGKPYDEREYINSVAAACGVAAGLVESPAPDEASLLASLERSRDLPDFPTGESLMRPLFDRARSRGIRVILTGIGGDEWFAGTSLYYADLIRRGRWLALARQLRAVDPDSELSWTWRDVVRAGVFPLVPAAVRRSARRLVGSAVPKWINPALARRVDLATRLQWPPLVPFRGSYERGGLHRLLTSGWEAFTNELIERGGAAHGVEYRHPFSDRRLVELAMAMPAEQRVRGRFTKFALRTAMRDRLPEVVRHRVSKADLSEIYLLALGALGGERAFDQLAIEDAGWIDGPAVRAMARRAFAEAGGDYGAVVIPLWMVLAVDRWFRAIMTRGPA
jgi:asparagine synthase (glutamine-hydrolysing)